MVIFSPRILFSPCLFMPIKFRSPNSASPSALPLAARSPMAPIINWLLPEPDSPTIAIVSPTLTVIFAPFTADTLPSSVSKLIFTFLSSSTGFISAILRIQRIAQAVANEIQCKQRAGEEECGDDQHIARPLHIARTL